MSINVNKDNNSNSYFAGQSVFETASLKGTDKKSSIYVIESRKMIRDCLEKCLIKAFDAQTIMAFASINEWDQSKVLCRAGDIIILCCDAHDTPQIEEDRNDLLSRPGIEARFVFLCDSEDLAGVVEQLNKGAHGYIPTSVGLNVAIEAIRLVQAGGIFIPSSCVFQHCEPIESVTPRSQFTRRQSAVLEQLQTGRSNKIIAFELKMKESTVKVHVRNIMRRLGVTNRTQVVVETYGKTVS
ncbi:response regulator transcription factor [Methylobacterium terricola]|uniref:Response regulator transcription factor n=1 Tax=Methylobacterium terricola TaxID=2583531 RepID=A0A5C4L5L7_9HYPH|nr:response regulator transcription factor [Methylobacterium terricola]TNC05118.1 response regulator transcription factor [Methylobacterium terricola]